MTAGNSASRQAAAIRAHARRGLWRSLLAAAGVTAHTRRADARAALWDRGAQGEAATAELLGPLVRARWAIRHDVRLSGARWNIDTVLVSPCGTAVVVLDTKAWRRTWPTRVVRGRVYCGDDDRHVQVEKVAGYAQRIAAALGLPGVTVMPLLVVHGSPVAGGHLKVRVPGCADPVYVLSPPYLVPTLASAPKLSDRRRAGVVVARVDSVLRPYSDGV